MRAFAISFDHYGEPAIAFGLLPGKGFSIKLPLLGQLVSWLCEPDERFPRFDHWKDGDAHHFQVGRRTFVWDTAATLPCEAGGTSRTGPSVPSE